VARSADEAERLARGENVTVRREDEGAEAEAEAAAAKAAAEKFFEPAAVPPADDDAKAEEKPAKQ
jgi:large subunit ribosomal protein L9